MSLPEYGHHQRFACQAVEVNWSRHGHPRDPRCWCVHLGAKSHGTIYGMEAGAVFEPGECIREAVMDDFGNLRRVEAA